MRIGIDLIGINPLYSGGVSTFSIGLAKGLARASKKSDSITVFISEINENHLKSVLHDVPVKFVKIKTLRARGWVLNFLLLISWITRNFKILFYFDKYFRSSESIEMEREVDIIIIPTTTLTFFALRVPTILCPHDIQQEYYPEFFTKKERIYRWVAYRLSCWAATSIQVSSLYIKNCIIEKFEFIHPNKIFIAYEGVDLEAFNSEKKVENTELSKLINNEFFAFYPAQIWPHKNHMLLLSSLVNFRDKHGFEMLCILTGQDYGYWSTLLKKIKDLKLKKIIYLGKVDFENVIWLYQNCGVVLALGLHESSSLPLREGAVFGKQLICTNIPPNVEIQNLLSLRLVDCIDSKELSVELDNVLMRNKEIIAREQNNMNCMNVFDWNEIAQIYLNESSKILSKNNFN
jgi:glycosyltransferase involved in cell wall biosynthesis